MALLRASLFGLFIATVTHGAPAPVPAPDPNPGLPSLLTINSEEELGLYSKKWRMTPVQMCTLMGHQMTVAQPLLDINHPLVSHLPSIGEMAMSDAVMICEKVLNDAKGRTASVTTVVEETRQGTHSLSHHRCGGNSPRVQRPAGLHL
uniref:Uncharacterized protein n=1 Tax=Graphocephala atropunctata TaxID=36148 RepID=A0A1B6L079_9HEMI